MLSPDDPRIADRLVKSYWQGIDWFSTSKLSLGTVYSTLFQVLNLMSDVSQVFHRVFTIWYFGQFCCYASSTNNVWSYLLATQHSLTGHCSWPRGSSSRRETSKLLYSTKNVICNPLDGDSELQFSNASCSVFVDCFTIFLVWNTKIYQVW